VIAIVLAAGRILQHWKTLIRVACVVAVAVTSIAHVVADFTMVNAAPISVVAMQPDADGSCDSTTAVERCHSCCVVSFLAFAGSFRREIAGDAVPDGRLLHLFSFRQPLTAPPPRTLI
jgi:hypothetical protein